MALEGLLRLKPVGVRWSVMEPFGNASSSLWHLQLRRSIIFISIFVLIAFTALLSFRQRETIKVYVRGKTGIAAATNATLGFEKILALSTGAEWRLNGLHAAASLTGLKIDVPKQPGNPQDLVQAFAEIGPPEIRHPSPGSARAWLAHLDLLKFVVQSRLSSVLIVEDDVDWDTGLLETVILPMANGIRTYTNATTDFSPYGENWDVLWMGHCGEVSYASTPYHAWPDQTVIPHEQYIGWAKPGLVDNIPEGVRTTHPTTQCVCTFAYATTGLGAQKILEHIGAGKGEAFDVQLSEICRDKKLSCITIQPEIFHQYVPPNDEYGPTSEIGAIDDQKEVFTGKAPDMGTTANIKNSARCKALFDTTCQQLPG